MILIATSCAKKKKARAGFQVQGSLLAIWLNSRLVGSFWGTEILLFRVNSAGKGSTQQVIGQLGNQVWTVLVSGFCLLRST